MNAEMRERHTIASDLDKALLRLDVDGLRFVLCVAIVRSMSLAELNKVAEYLLVSGTENGSGDRR